jgi:hypothetical protein
VFNGWSWVTVTDSSSLDLTNGMTLEAWVHPTAAPGTWTTVLLKETAGDLAYMIQGDPANYPTVFIRTASGLQGIAGPTALPLNTWSHLAGTYNGATLELYVNGIQVASNPVSGSVVTSPAPLRIGGNAVWGEYFIGSIDDVRIYNRGLSSVEIQTDMSRAIGAVPVISLAVAPQTAEQIAHDGFRFYVAADGPGTFAIESSTNLASWQQIGTLQYTNGQVEMLDTNANLSPSRFYRASQP